jgi:hypothetical protein
VIACTLEPAAVPGRLADWEGVLTHVRARSPLGEGGMRLELDPDVEVGEVARLVVAEQRCCSFFSFALTVDQRGVGLEVRAPDAAADLVAELFG